MYGVKFIRRDGQPDEIYYYHKKEDAEYHLHLFDNDDSGLYSNVILSILQTVSVHSSRRLSQTHSTSKQCPL